MGTMVMGIMVIADIMATGITDIAGIMGMDMDTIVPIIIVMVTMVLIQDTEIGIITATDAINT
jgi:hypothetical protein